MPGHRVWCADRHVPPIRVSAIQSGNWSGPVEKDDLSGSPPFTEGAIDYANYRPVGIVAHLAARQEKIGRSACHRDSLHATGVTRGARVAFQFRQVTGQARQRRQSPPAEPPQIPMWSESMA